MEGPTSLITRIHSSYPDGIDLATSISSLKTTEFELVQGILHILQGNSSALFEWDEMRHRFCAKVGIYVAHLSLTSLRDVLNQFLYTATCLRLIGIVIEKIERSGGSFPTMRAFASAASAWLKKLRDIALNVEVKMCNSYPRTVPTLLGLTNSLSSLCSGAEFLLQIVYEVVPKVWLYSPHSATAAEVAVHVLDHLYKRLNEACLMQGGEEEAYKMLLFLFVGSLLPYIQSLESWIYEGILDDPYNEGVGLSESHVICLASLQEAQLFFYENKSVSISDTDFWEQSYLLRSVTHQKVDTEVSGVAPKDQVCPLFMKDVAKEIVSAGKSLQLIRHVPMTLNLAASRGGRYGELDSVRIQCGATYLDDMHDRHSIAGLTLVEVFFVSISGLLGHGDRVYKYFLQDDFSLMVDSLLGRNMEREKLETNYAETSDSKSPRKIWVGFLNNVVCERESSSKVEPSLINVKLENAEASIVNELRSMKSFCPENPAMTVCQKISSNRDAQRVLRLSKNYDLPPLNDEDLRTAIYNFESTGVPTAMQTNCAFGFQFSESQYLRSLDDAKTLGSVFPFPTILPSWQEDLQISELLPVQKTSTLCSRILRWIQISEPKDNPLPMVILQECLNVYIKKQVDHIGGHMLSKLLKDWRLIDELEVLRAIYLLGSGDLLQHFLTVIFNRLDKGESWDDDFELNLILQESIRNSADAMLLNAPDSLAVSIIKPRGLGDDNNHNMANILSTPRKGHENSLGINGLDVLNFSYKVSWPLELIANSEAIRKYNQVMHFLLKVKRAKYVLDKARRWIWKGKAAVTLNSKRHWLVEQKLLHFVDAFHQYVMDRVYHSAWREMCQAMAAASSLDEVIDVHDAYLLSIQRQCFIVPDKLWALIASRINTILGLALDFYSIQRTLHSGGSLSAIKARCEMEVDRIEKQFDDCIAFLLRVLSFKLNVGHFPHLADLVTRINYNYYYVS